MPFGIFKQRFSNKTSKSIDLDVTRQQLTRTEKYAFFLKIRDQAEEDVIRYIKDNISTLTSIFWFEILQKTTDTGYTIDKVSCSCSKDLELGYKDNVAYEELMARLEFCIRTGMCPHVFMKQREIQVDVDADVSAEVVNRYLNGVHEYTSVRNQNKNTAGVYWIHLAVFFGKETLVREILSFFCTLKIEKSYLRTLKHELSPVLLAVVHQQMSISKLIGKTYRYLISFQTKDLNITSYLGNVSVLEKDVISSLLWLLAYKRFADFQMLWTMANEEFIEHSWRADINRIWLQQTIAAFTDKQEAVIDLLIEVKGISISTYVLLFEYFRRYGHTYMYGYRMVLENTDFVQRSLAVIQKIPLRPKSMTITREALLVKGIVAKLALYGDAKQLQLFIDYGFKVNTKFANLSLLDWTKALNLTDVSKVLSKAKIQLTKSTIKKSMIDLALDLRLEHSFTEKDIVHVLHVLLENGYNSYASSFMYDIWKHNFYRIMKYMFFRGTDPMEIFDISTFWNWKFFYLVITTNSKPEFIFSISKDSFIFHSRFCFRILSVLPRVGGHSAVQDLVSEDTFDWIKTHQIPTWTSSDHVQWFSRVNSLQEMCRSTLSSHFKSYYYYRYLKKIQTSVPVSIYEYLKKQDIIQDIFKFYPFDWGKFEKEMAEVDEYFI